MLYKAVLLCWSSGGSEEDGEETVTDERDVSSVTPCSVSDRATSSSVCVCVCVCVCVQHLKKIQLLWFTTFQQDDFLLKLSLLLFLQFRLQQMQQKIIHQHVNEVKRSCT